MAALLLYCSRYSRSWSELEKENRFSAILFLVGDFLLDTSWFFSYISNKNLSLNLFYLDLNVLGKKNKFNGLCLLDFWIIWFSVPSLVAELKGELFNDDLEIVASSDYNQLTDILDQLAKVKILYKTLWGNFNTFLKYQTIIILFFCL